MILLSAVSVIYHHLFGAGLVANHDHLTQVDSSNITRLVAMAKNILRRPGTIIQQNSHLIYTTDFLVNFRNLNLSKPNKKLSQLPMFHTCLTQEKIPKTWTQRCAPVLTMVVQKLYAKPWRLTTVFFLRERWGMWRYCWWFRDPAHQLRLVIEIPLFTRFLYIPGGCLGILPSAAGLKMEL